MAGVPVMVTENDLVLLIETDDQASVTEIVFKETGQDTMRDKEAIDLVTEIEIETDRVIDLVNETDLVAEVVIGFQEEEEASETETEEAVSETETEEAVSETEIEEAEVGIDIQTIDLVTIGELMTDQVVTLTDVMKEETMIERDHVVKLIENRLEITMEEIEIVILTIDQDLLKTDEMRTKLVNSMMIEELMIEDPMIEIEIWIKKNQK